MVCFFPIIEPYLTIKLNIFNFFMLKKYSRVKIVCPHKAQSDHESSSNLTYSWPLWCQRQQFSEHFRMIAKKLLGRQ